MRPARDRIEVAGATISLLRWGRAGDPRIVLVHGGAAHAGWWSHLAPALAVDHEVVALDLSGHGDSDHREQYRFSTWAEEVLACGGATVVGHSMGGIVATLAAADPESVRRLILVDTPLRRPEADNTGDADATLALVRTYPTRDAAIARFRPLPPQPITDHALADLVAAGSVRHGSEGWRWKYDQRAFVGEGPPDRPTDITPELGALRCPVTAVVGELSVIVTPDERSVLRRLGDYREIPGGHHHLMLDAPDALAAALLDTLVTDPRRSLPATRGE